MKEGLLWYDDSSRPLAQRVAIAVARYVQKMNSKPNVCYVHPAALMAEPLDKLGPVAVKPLRSVLRHHFWVGREVVQ